MKKGHHMNKYLIALDIGGTKAEAVLFSPDGHIFHRIVDPAGTPFEYGVEQTLEKTGATLRRLLSVLPQGATVAALYASIATVEYYMEAFTAYFRQNFPQIPSIRIEGDGCCLISGMLGHRDGAALICGTGSSLYLRTGDSYRHLGGGGHMIDSAGSGYCLGRLALQASLRAVNGGSSQTLLTELVNAQGGAPMWDNLPEIYARGRAYIASFAGCVFAARQQGDIVARQIFNTCATDLSNVIWAARHQLGHGFDLVLNGGIVTHYPEYAAAIHALGPGDVKMLLSDVPPIWGAAVEALYDAGLPADEAVKDGFLSSYQQLLK